MGNLQSMSEEIDRHPIQATDPEITETTGSEELGVNRKRKERDGSSDEEIPGSPGNKKSKTSRGEEEERTDETDGVGKNKGKQERDKDSGEDSESDSDDKPEGEVSYDNGVVEAGNGDGEFTDVLSDWMLDSMQEREEEIKEARKVLQMGGLRDIKEVDIKWYLERGRIIPSVWEMFTYDHSPFNLRTDYGPERLGGVASSRADSEHMEFRRVLKYMYRYAYSDSVYKIETNRNNRVPIAKLFFHHAAQVLVAELINATNKPVNDHGFVNICLAHEHILDSDPDDPQENLPLVRRVFILSLPIVKQDPMSNLPEFILKPVRRCPTGRRRFYPKVLPSEPKFSDETLKKEEKEIDDFMRNHKKENGYGAPINRFPGHTRHTGVAIVSKIRERRSLEVFKIPDEVIENDLDSYTCAWGHKDSRMTSWILRAESKTNKPAFVKEGEERSVGTLKYYSVSPEKFEFLKEYGEVDFSKYVLRSCKLPENIPENYRETDKTELWLLRNGKFTIQNIMNRVPETNDGFGVYAWHSMEAPDKGAGFPDLTHMRTLDDVITGYEYRLGMESIGEGYGSNVKG